MLSSNDVGTFRARLRQALDCRSLDISVDEALLGSEVNAANLKTHFDIQYWAFKITLIYSPEIGWLVGPLAKRWGPCFVNGEWHVYFSDTDYNCNVDFFEAIKLKEIYTKLGEK